MQNSSNDSDNEAYDGVDRSLARELLSEEEMQYFAGQKKNKPLSSIFSKRSAATTALEQHVDKPVEADTLLLQQTENHPNDTTKKGSKVKVIAAGVVLVLLVVIAVIFNLMTSNSSSTSENVAVAEDKPSIKQSVADNHTTVTPSSSTDEDNQVILSEQKIELASNADESESSNATASIDSEEDKDPSVTEPPLTPKQEVVDGQVLQNEESASVSYEDFAKEAQTTLYRDSDY